MTRLHVLETSSTCATSAPPRTIDLRGRRVVLLGLDWSRDKDPRLPLGQASLAASLEARGATVRNLSYAINGARLHVATIVDDVLVAALLDENRWADLGIGVYVWNDALVLDLCRELRERGFTGRIILGGPQITYHAPGVADSYPHADAFVRGAGERAIVAIAGDDAHVDHVGVVWRGEPDRGEQAVVDLEQTPSPYLSGTLDPAQHRRFIRWETKRGCPFRCSFCQHRDPGSRPRVLEFTEGRIAAEVAAFVDAGVESIAVLDPIFNDKRFPYLQVLDLLIAAEYQGQISLQCRFEMVSPAFIERCRALNVVLEFGLQTVHPSEWSVVRRGNNLRRIDDAITALHAAGLSFEVSLIYGLPTQTLNSFRATVTWCLERRIPVIKAFPLMLLRGTELERTRDRWGLQESDDEIPMVIASDTFTAEEHASMGRIAEALIATEGDHPRTIDEFISGWSGPLTLSRWTPLPPTSQVVA